MEFRDKPMQNLVRIPEKDICKNAQKLLLDGETVVGAYKTVRDQVVFTTHRIILVDMQGVTGTRQEIFVLPYRKVLHFGIQTAGILFTPFRVFVFFIFILFSFLFFLFPERNAVYKINHQNDHHPSQDLDHCHCIGSSKLGSRTGNGKLAYNVTDTVGSCSSFCQEINLVIKKEAGGCSKNGYCF